MLRPRRPSKDPAPALRHRRKVRGEERIVGVHAWGRAQVVYGETRRRSLFRTTKIIFYPTIFSTFGVLGQLGRQKGAKSALRRHQMIDFRPFRTPSRGIAAFSHHGHFSPTDRSTCTPRRGKQTTRSQSTSSIHPSLSMVCRISSVKRSVAIATIMVFGGLTTMRCRRP